MKKNNFVNFIEEVKQEAGKITWPEKKEIISFSLLVFLIVSISSIFFLLVDMLMHNIVQIILNF